MRPRSHTCRSSVVATARNNTLLCPKARITPFASKEPDYATGVTHRIVTGSSELVGTRSEFRLDCREALLQAGDLRALCLNHLRLLVDHLLHGCTA